MTRAEWLAQVERPPDTESLLRLAHSHEGEQLTLLGAGSTGLEAWFLGPKAENGDLLHQLIAMAIDAQIESRQRTYPTDPAWITENDQASDSYRKTAERLRHDLDALNTALDQSVPFYSYRYQSHMLWDITLPSIVGYIAGMLRNQNNVAVEASPVTTFLEMQVGDDLCRMLGYHVPTQNDTGSPEEGVRAWGHITADGSIANIEAMWAARNLKFYPLGVKDALSSEPLLDAARDIEVRVASGASRPLREQDDWTLLNLSVDEVLAVPDRIREKIVEVSRDPAAGDAALEVLNNYSPQRTGIGAFTRRLDRQGIGEPVILSPATNHYSWPKGAALLGLGSANLEPVSVDQDGRMRLDHLRSILSECAAPATRRPVMAVVAVIGTTAESSVDPLAGILEERDRVRAGHGLDFFVHADAAWGGYFASMMRPSPELSATLDELAADSPETLAIDRIPIATAMNKHVVAQYEQLHMADSITVDPHKSGFIPYPAGALCYRNSRARNLVAFTAPVIYREGEASVGVYGIEGSKPGAAATSVFLSHRLIRPDQSGYGRILGRCLFNSKRFYMALLTMPGDDDPFTVTPMQRTPTQRLGPKDEDERENLRRIYGDLHDDAEKHALSEAVVEPDEQLAAMELALFRRLAAMSNRDLVEWIDHHESHQRFFREIGPDQVIMAYSFNLRSAEVVNKRPDVANAFNQRIFDSLSMRKFTPVLHVHTPDDRANDEPDRVPPMIVTSSRFDPATHGNEFVRSYMQRMGLEGEPVPIDFLISTMMNPFVTDTAEGNLLPSLMSDMRAEVTAIAREIVR